MCAADRPLLVVTDAGARLVRRGLVAPGDAARWHGARVVVFRRGPVVCELPAARVDAPSRAPYLSSRSSSVCAAHDARALQHADAPRRAVPAARAPAGYALLLRPHRLELRAPRELPHVPVRGPAAPLPRRVGLPGVPHHEPDGRG